MPKQHSREPIRRIVRRAVGRAILWFIASETPWLIADAAPWMVGPARRRHPSEWKPLTPAQDLPILAIYRVQPSLRRGEQ